MTRLLLDRNLVLAAGAGSGKTHALVTVALGLYGGAGGRPPIDPTRVWTVTFTDKAAAELGARIADRARRLARGERDEEVERLGGEIPRERWGEVVRLLSVAPIGTFHGLCAELLRRHPAEARVDPRFAILDEAAAHELFERAREEAILAALEAGSARPLVSALGGLDGLRGAIDHLHAKLAEEGREPRSLVFATDGAPLPPFDLDRAIPQLAAACARVPLAVARLAGCDVPRLARAVDVARRERPRLLGCDPARVGEWYGAMIAIGAARGGGGLGKKAAEVWDPFDQAKVAVKSALAAVGQAEGGRAFVALLDDTVARYRLAKRRHRGLDFADLIRRARDLLRDDLELRREEKARVGALLVDEFQDTNALQLELAWLLGEARDEERALLDGRAAVELPLEPAILCVVGDRKQSIYEFRGADVSIFSALIDRARGDESFRLQPLTRSHRSRPRLVEFANRAFRRILSQPGNRPYEILWSESEDALEPAREERLEGAPVVELIDTVAGLGATARRPDEAEAVASWVRGLLASGRLVEPRGSTARAVRGEDVAILLRTFTSLGTYRRALTRAGVPHVVFGGRGFHGSREVRDLAALLTALADPWDRFAAAALLRSPLVGLSDDALLLLSEARALSLAQPERAAQVALSDEDRLRLARVAPLFARLSRESDRLGPAGVIRLAVDELDLLPQLAAADGGEQQVANVRKLIARLERLPTGSALRAGLRLLDAADDDRDREPHAELLAADPRAIRILTVHAAKGLEFPVVVVPELGTADRNDGMAVQFDRVIGLSLRPVDPLGERISDPHAESVQEELRDRSAAEGARLLYVALTRARDLLALCGEQGARPVASAWRARLEPTLVDAAELVTRVTPPSELLPLPVDEGDPCPVSAETVIARVRPPLVAGGRFVGAVTELAALDRCERRYFYRAVVGLEEHGGVQPLVELELDDGDLPSLDRMARGTLAHRLLERADLTVAASDPGAAVAEVARTEGLELEHPEVRALIADAAALLEGPLGRQLVATARGRIWRELPFAFEVRGAAGATLALKGQVDLLFIDGDETLNVIDYKHASGHGQLPDAYAFQLRTYALAARRAEGRDIPVRAGVAWLRDRGARPALMPISEAALAEHEARLGGLADRLAAATVRGVFRKLPSRSECGDCGYVVRCWGRAPAEQLALFPGSAFEPPPPRERTRKRRR